MNHSLCKVSVLVAGLLFFAGCSLDQTAVFDHPDRVAGAQQFDVSVYNQYLYVTSGGSFIQPVIRDSVHLSVGLPNGWTTIGAKYYYASHVKIIDLMNAINDTAAFYLAMRDSAILYKSRATSMTFDNNFSTLLANRTYQAKRWNSDDSLQVNTDSVSSWRSYRGLTNISFPQGTKVDTVIIDTLGDSIGVTAMPIFMWVTVQSGITPGADTLFYFSKTSKMPLKTDTNGIDIGDMVYAPITIVGASALPSEITKPKKGVTVYADTKSNRVIFNLGDESGLISGLRVYSLRGTLIADVTSSLRFGVSSIEWKPPCGSIPNGVYVLHAVSGTGRTTVSFRILN